MPELEEGNLWIRGTAPLNQTLERETESIVSQSGRDQLLTPRLCRDIHDVLQRQPDHAIDRDYVPETIVTRMPSENYEKVFNTFVRWARFGDLFTYDEGTQRISRI